MPLYISSIRADQALVKANGFKIQDATTTTKQLAFDVSNISAVTTRSLALPDRDVNLSSHVPTGFASWTPDGDGRYYTISGTTFTLTCTGYGYINGSKVTWAAGQSVTLTANRTTYVYIDVNATIGAALVPTGLYGANIVLFEVLYDGTATLVKPENHPFDFPHVVSSFIHHNFGPIVRAAGGDISAGTGGNNRAVNVSAGTYEDHGIIQNLTDTAPTGATWDFWYLNASSQWKRYSSPTQTFTAVYSLSGAAPTAVGSQYFAVFRLYAGMTVNDTGTPHVFEPHYVAIIHNARFNTTGSADTAIANGTIVSSDQGTFGELAQLELAQLGYVVVSGGTNTISKVTIQKSTFNARYIGGTAGTTSHLTLTDLTGGTYGDAGHTGLVPVVLQTTDPTVDSDSTAYRAGGLWINTVKKTLHHCVDATLGAAVWYELSRRDQVFSFTTSTALTIQNRGIILCSPTAGSAITITLPTSNSDCAGYRFFIVKANALSSGNTVTVDPNGATINYSTGSIVLNNQGERLNLLCDGLGNWFLM